MLQLLQKCIWLISFPLLQCSEGSALQPAGFCWSTSVFLQRLWPFSINPDFVWSIKNEFIFILMAALAICTVSKKVCHNSVKWHFGEFVLFTVRLHTEWKCYLEIALHVFPPMQPSLGTTPLCKQQEEIVFTLQQLISEMAPDSAGHSHLYLLSQQRPLCVCCVDIGGAV